MSYLLDVNVLVAWGWSDHADHHRAAAWMGQMVAKRDVVLATSAIPELGFVRVSVQRTGGLLSVIEAADTLSGMLGALGKSHAFLPDDQPSCKGWPSWCSSASRTTDAHLLALAENHGFRLATLDEAISCAFLIPKPID
jgi:predicted nucleic acid-binding protein